MKSVVLLLSVAILAGCNATMPTAPKRLTAADDPSNTCYRSLSADPLLITLASKVGDPANADTITMDMMANNERATDDEKKVVQHWGAARQRCHDLGAAFRSANAPPPYRSLAEDGNSDGFVMLSKLYSGQFTFGQFNADRKRLRNEYRAKFDALRSQENQQNAMAQQAESARRAQASADFRDAMLIMQANRPQPIAPLVMPQPQRPVNCTSRRVFNQIETTCQ